jgi:hypothetical protein
MAQKEFEDKREQIADNIDALIQQFAKSLKFDITLSDSEIQQIKQNLPDVNDSISQEFVDSVWLSKINNAKQPQRDLIYQSLLNNFQESKKDPSQLILNFAFDSLAEPEKYILVDDFAENYVGLYDKTEGKFMINYSSTSGYIPNLRPYLSTEAIINKYSKGYSVLIPFILDPIKATYDSTGPALLKLPNDTQQELLAKELFNSEGSNIKLLANVFFKNPDNISSFKLLSLNSPEDPVENPVLQAFLKTTIIENLKLYGRLNLQGDSPDSTLVPSMLKLFEDPEKKSMQCSLFFSNEVCESLPKDSKDSTSISPVQYCENIIHNYDYVGTFNINMVDNGLVVNNNKGKNYDVVKWPAKIRFIPNDFDDITPEGLGQETLTNLYFKVDYKSLGLLKEGKDYKDATITDITTKNIDVVISQPTKKGSFSYALNYNPMYYHFQLDQNSAFKDFASEWNVSNGIGLDVGYYWFGKKKGRFLGINTGVHFDMMKSSMSLDSIYYTQTFPSNENPLGENHVIAYEEQVWVNDFRQSVKFNFISIPVMFNYMTTLNSLTLFNLGVGANISITNKNSVELLQDEGTSTHKGWYQIEFPDETTGEYIMENPGNTVDGYGYVTDAPAHIADVDREINSTLIFLAIKPSFSIPITEKNENIYLDLGLSFQYGLNTLYNVDAGNGYIMDSPGNSNAVYSSGVKNNDFVVGFSVGFRYFNSDDKQKDKIFRF